MYEDRDALAAQCGAMLERSWRALHGGTAEGRGGAERALAVVDRCVSTPPDGWRSLVSDDHTPVEVSVAFGAGEPQLRLLFEAQGDAPTPGAQARSARALDGWLEEEHGARLERLRELEEIFLPEDHRGAFGLWHGAIFAPDGSARFKVYLDPYARGREHASELVRQALERLGNPGAWDAVAALAERGPELDEVRFFSLDLTAPEEARIKVYVAKHRATVSEVVRASRLAKTHDTGGLLRFFEAAAGGAEGVLAAERPVVPCFDFVGTDPRPRHYTVHFPVRAYAAHDAEARERVTAVFEAMGHGTDRLDALVDAFATRELSAGSGLFAYVSHRAEASGPRLTVYLSTEARSVGAPHESLTPVAESAENDVDNHTRRGAPMASEEEVREFYDEALHCYQQFMGDRWHHGDPDAKKEGLPALRACEILEEKIVAQLDLTEGARVLDFGSGIGGPTLHMAKVTGASFVGVTNNERLNRLARHKAEELGLSDRVQFVTLGDTDYKRFPFADDSFDAVTFYESVCHIPDKAALFQEIGRILKPGGRVGGMDWLQRPFGEHRSEAQIMELMGPLNELTAIPGHGSVESYSKMMEDAGLEVSIARDLYEGVKSEGEATPDEQAEWLDYQGPEGERFAKGKKALDDARDAGVFTVGMFVAVKPGGARRESLVDRLQRFEDEPMTEHPFFQRLASEPLEMKRLWLLLRNFQEGVTSDFARRLAQIVARVDEDDLRSVLAKQLDDELGNGDPDRAHRLLFDRFVAGMSDYRPDGVDERTSEPGRKLGAFLEDVYAHRDPYEGVGATLLMEVGGRQVDQFLGDQFRRGSDLPPAVLEWLTLHETLEEDHVDEVFELAARIPEGAKTEAAHRGLGALADAVWAFFDDMHRLAWPS